MAARKVPPQLPCSHHIQVTLRLHRPATHPSPHAALPHPGYPVARSERRSSSPPHHIQVTLRPCHIQATLWAPRSAAAARRPTTSRLPCGCTGRPPTPALTRPCHIQATLWAPRSAAASRRPITSRLPCGCTGRPPTPQPSRGPATSRLPCGPLGALRQLAARHIQVTL